MEGGFHLPYTDWIQPVTEPEYHLIHNVQYIYILCLGLGIYGRFCCLCLVFLQGWIFFADQLNFRNHPLFFLILLIALTFAPCDEALSVRRLFRMWESKKWSVERIWGGVASVTGQRLIQVEVCIAYFVAGLHKLNVWFLSGARIERSVTNDFGDWSGHLWWLPEGAVQSLLAFLLLPGVLIFASVGSAAFELIAPFSLWFRRLLLPTILVGCGFHLSIAFFMDIHTFSYAMLASYLLFLPERWWQKGKTAPQHSQ